MFNIERLESQGLEILVRIKEKFFITAHITYENYEITRSGIQNQTSFVARLGKRKARVIRVQRMLRISHAAKRSTHYLHDVVA